MHNHEYMSMTDLGKLFGLSSHDIGRRLVALGLRTPYKQPSQYAHAAGYVQYVPTQRTEAYGYFVWHKVKTLEALQSAGLPCFEKLHGPPETLAGPFTLQADTEHSFRLVDSNGTTGIWVTGRRNAEDVLYVLNRAAEDGLFCPVEQEQDA